MAERQTGPDEVAQRSGRETRAAEKHLTPDELAERCGVPKKTIYEWNSKGTGPRYMRMGNHARYRLADVVSWENDRYADGGGEAA